MGQKEISTPGHGGGCFSFTVIIIAAAYLGEIFIRSLHL